MPTMQKARFDFEIVRVGRKASSVVGPTTESGLHVQYGMDTVLFRRASGIERARPRRRCGQATALKLRSMAAAEPERAVTSASGSEGLAGRRATRAGEHSARRLAEPFDRSLPAR